jgi:hypothetical protein
MKVYSLHEKLIMKLIDYPIEKRKFMPTLPRYEPFFQDHSATIVFKNCARKYFYRIVLGRTSKTSPYQVVFDFGSAYHKFREILELEGYGKAMEFVMSVTLAKPNPGSKFEYLNELRLLKTCQAAYEHWQKEKQSKRIEVVAVEQPFNVQLTDDLFISGRADQIVKWNGKLWGRDFKTTSKDQVAFSRGLDPNDQATRYIVGESLLHGQQVQGILFEAVYNTKTVGPKIFTIPASRVKYQLDTWEREQIFLFEWLKMSRENDIWPMQEHNCSFCDFHKVCTKGSEQAMEATLKMEYNLSPWDHNAVEQKVID